MEDLFEKISRQKLRFESPRGLLTVEDLWDLPLTSSTGKPNLDDIAKDLNRRVKDTRDEVSFVEPVEKTDAANYAETAFAAIKRVIEVRLAERKATRESQARSEKRQQILGIIAQKENEALSGASMDELKKLLETL